MTKDCTTCNNAWIKDFVYLICSVNGILDLKDVENSKNCKDYEERENDCIQT